VSVIIQLVAEIESLTGQVQVLSARVKALTPPLTCEVCGTRKNVSVSKRRCYDHLYATLRANRDKPRPTANRIRPHYFV
jgi:hypothetical protein